MSKHSEVKKRIEAVIKKAEEGDRYSMRLLAFMYSRGMYLPKDYIAAQAWYTKAAELDEDDYDSRRDLAKLLSEGNGIAGNLEAAFDIYQDLMFGCDVESMYEVGLCYKLGKGIPKDEKKGSYYIDMAFEIERDLDDQERLPENPKGKKNAKNTTGKTTKKK